MDGNRTKGFKNHFLLQAVGAGVEGPGSVPRGGGPWEFPGISRAFLSRISGGETQCPCRLLGTEVKGQNPTLSQNNDKHTPPEGSRPPILYGQLPLPHFYAEWGVRRGQEKYRNWECLLKRV